MPEAPISPARSLPLATCVGEWGVYRDSASQKRWETGFAACRRVRPRGYVRFLQTGGSRMAWADRPRKDRLAIVGAIAGMVVAGVIAFMFAFESSTIVRYIIMVIGLVAGWGIGRWLGSR
jgi:hypothetical protein